MVKRQACIAIGINHYDFLQPLSYAQQDAQALQDFLVGEVGLAPERCLLMTDTSPPVCGHSTIPSRDNILQSTERFCEQLQPEDLLWYFWCGYGMSWDGQDYLMPIEGDRANIPQTGIQVKDIFKTLKAARSQSVLVMLDINRATSIHADDAIALDTVALAKQLEIPTMLSCRSGQFSHESSSLRHGLFAAALLEALRYHRCITVEDLDKLMSKRLPQLSDHLLLPVQEPLTVVNPREKIHQLIWQPKENGAEIAVKLSITATNGYAQQQAIVTPSIWRYNVPDRGSKNGTSEVTRDFVLPENRVLANSHSGHNVNGKNEIAEKPAQTLQDLEKKTVQGKIEQGKTNGQIAKNSSQIKNKLSQLAALAAKADKPGRSQQLAMWSGATALVLLLGVFVSKAAFVERQPADASLSTVPSGTKVNSPLLSPAPSLVQSPTNSQMVMDRALLAIQPTDASKFGYAIAIARKIPQQDPLYEQAQQNIDRWGGVILDVARGRAKQGNFNGAIAAAKLVPSDRLKLHARTQELIDQWQDQLQLQQANDKLLKAAAASIRKKQVSSYAGAIATVRKIPPGQPKYSEAQQLIAQWSQTILDIARSRYSRGKLSAAIEIASSVPPETPAYPDAVAAIAQWKRQLKTR